MQYINPIQVWKNGDGGKNMIHLNNIHKFKSLTYLIIIYSSHNYDPFKEYVFTNHDFAQINPLRPMAHITIIGPDNDLLPPGRLQAIIWNSAGIL